MPNNTTGTQIGSRFKIKFIAHRYHNDRKPNYAQKNAKFQYHFDKIEN